MRKKKKKELQIYLVQEKDYLGGGTCIIVAYDLWDAKCIYMSSPVVENLLENYYEQCFIGDMSIKKHLEVLKLVEFHRVPNIIYKGKCKGIKASILDNKFYYKDQNMPWYLL